MTSFRIRKLILLAADFLIITVSTHFSIYLLDATPLFSFFKTGPYMITGGSFEIYRIPFLGLPFGAVLNAIVSVGILVIAGIYNKMWRYFKGRDYVSCVLSLLSGLILSALLQIVIRQSPSLLLSLLTFIISAFGIILFRLFFRNAFLGSGDFADKQCKNGKRTLIVGAGKATRLILTEIKNANKDKALLRSVGGSQICPVCLVDDDSSKLGMEIDNIKVVGNTTEIPEIVKKYNIEGILLCIPSASVEEQTRILDIMSGTGCDIRSIPYLSQLIFSEGHSIISQMKEIKIEDLLGREPVTFGKKDVKGLIEGKVCMVTGGGGSIGAELVRQIAKYGAKQIVILDIYENNAYEIQQELIMDYGDTINLETVIASVRDYSKMEKLFAQYKPNLVFHAAAHKHVPLMEVAPEEAVKNNVQGTFNVSTLSEIYNVDKFIMISTDKAVNPTNVMGATKRCCEMIIQHKAQRSNHCEFVTTRFGNVLGSNGSVIPLFKKQIESGRPVTVTHPEVTRYFMTIPEAVSLVLQAGAMAKGGEIFVLDMGDPVKIKTLAENLIRLYGKVPHEQVEIKYTGLRPGEKLYEELLMNEEGLQGTENKKIFIGNQINVNSVDLLSKLDKLMGCAKENESDKVIELLQDLVPTFIRRNK